LKQRRPGQSALHAARILRKAVGFRCVAVSFVLVAALEAFGAGSAGAQRNPGDILIGEDADNYYYMEAAAYRGSGAEKFGTDFCRAQLATAADQNAIRQLGFAVDAERFDMYEEVARDQRAALKKTLLDALLDQGLQATDALLASGKSLNPWNVNNAVEMLRHNGFDYPLIVAALRRIALTKDKPAMLASYREFVESVRAAKEGWDAGSEAARDPDNSDLRLIVGALKVMLGNSSLGLAVSSAEVAESLVYLAYLSGQVSDLAQTTDDNLARLGSLAQRLKSHVDDKRKSKKAWQKATGFPTAKPVCTAQS
jgi:hypothetical protein